MINLHERMLPPRHGLNLQPPDHQSDAYPTEPPRPVNTFATMGVSKYETDRPISETLKVLSLSCPPPHRSPPPPPYAIGPMMLHIPGRGYILANLAIWSSSVWLSTGRTVIFSYGLGPQLFFHYLSYKDLLGKKC